MLGAVGEAIQLTTAIPEAGTASIQTPDILELAQTSQATGQQQQNPLAGTPGANGPIPDLNQLTEQAKKAMEKDDKKKMGKEKYDLFRKIKKTLDQKSGESRKMAHMIEDILEGKDTEKSKSRSKSRGRKKSRTPSPRDRSRTSSEERKERHQAEKRKVKDAVGAIKSRMEQNNKDKKKQQ